MSNGKSPIDTASHVNSPQFWCDHELANTVSTDWLQDHLDDPEVVLVDIRGRVNKDRQADSEFFATTYEGLEGDYLDSHIPNAIFVDWTKDIAKVDSNNVAAQLADRDSFVAAMQERGVGGDKRVVAYDNGDMLFATRFWWALRYFGHDGVSVLDGGWAKWLAEDREITMDCPCPLKVYTDWTLPLERERPGLISTAEDVKTAVASGRVQLLDARANKQFTGEVRRAMRGGHIPGSKNTPYRSFLREGRGTEGTYRVFRDLEGIREVFRDAGVDTSTSANPVIAYCNGGVASTMALFGLYQLQVKDGNGELFDWSNYDGSWNEWGNGKDEEGFVVER